MSSWFSVRVIYDGKNEKGVSIKKKEQYLVDAISFAEAEERVIGELTPYNCSDIRVTAMKIENIEEIFNQEEGDKWYRVKLMFVTINKNGNENGTAHVLLVNGKNAEDAIERVNEGMKGSVIDYKINTVSETQYMDVFFYSLEPENETTR